MMPTFPPGTNVWGFKWYNRLKVGDVVVFEHRGKEKIKRIVDIREDKLDLRGDNKSASTDSRDFGLVETDQVLAKVIWPRTVKAEED